ncbi:MAG: MobF family relaxase, partial [Acidimicrobiales bacterium]
MARRGPHVGPMLCVAKVRTGGHAYYLEVVDSGAEARGEWLSEGASRLGLSGSVEAPELEAVLAGADPSTQRGLGGARDRVKVAGFDLTFCAPKSVSLLHALGDSEVALEVRAGHREAVGQALSYVERHALAVRRGSGARRFPQAVQGVAGAAFVHRVSRALDPHLHTHVVVANLGMAPDGSWSALDGRGVYAHRSAAAAIYHSQLRHELTRRIGVEWGPLDRGRADIDGIAPEVRRQFSRRSAQIEANLAELGHRREAGPGEALEPEGGPRRVSSRAREVAAFATRAPRDASLAPQTLRPEWERRAFEVGLSPRRLEATLGRVGTLTVSDRPTELSEVGESVERSLSELGRDVARRDVVRTWCSSLPRGAHTASVSRAADEMIAGLERSELSAHRADRPGVGERRYEVDELHLRTPSELDLRDDPDLRRAAMSETRR